MVEVAREGKEPGFHVAKDFDLRKTIHVGIPTYNSERYGRVQESQGEPTDNCPAIDPQVIAGSLFAYLIQLYDPHRSKGGREGSLSSITFTDAYGSTTDGVGANHHNRTRTASSDLAHGSDADDEEQLQRYQLSKANAASASGRVLPPRPPLQEQTKKRKGHKRRRRQAVDNDAGEDMYNENLNVKIEFPSESDGILAPGNKPPSSMIEQGDLDCAYICTCFLLILILPILVYFYTNTSDSWRLHTGASRHVVISTTFSKSVSITRTPPTQEHGHENEVDTGGQFLAYHIDGGCPPLTGPELTLEHRRDLHLEAGAYDWNRYYLNPGSVLNVTVTANSGGVKAFLFRGKTAFESWRRDPSEYSSFFRRAHTYEGLIRP